jgi:hypothetical protein
LNLKRDISWFPSLCFQTGQLVVPPTASTTEEVAAAAGAVETLGGGALTPEVGLYKFNPVDDTHGLKAPGFNP